MVGAAGTQVEEARVRSPVPAVHLSADLASPLSQSPPPEHISCIQDKPHCWELSYLLAATLLLEYQGA